MENLKKSLVSYKNIQGAGKFTIKKICFSCEIKNKIKYSIQLGAKYSLDFCGSNFEILEDPIWRIYYEKLMNYDIKKFHQSPKNS